MLLKKQEKDGKIKAMYSSSTILASVYNTQNKELIIIFSNGGQYKYLGVVESDYNLFENTESQGKVLNSNIKKYSFDKLSLVDPTILEAIKKEIQELINSKSTTNSYSITKETLLMGMTELFQEFFNTNNLDNNKLKSLNDNISKYLTIK